MHLLFVGRLLFLLASASSLVSFETFRFIVSDERQPTVAVSRKANKIAFCCFLLLTNPTQDPEVSRASLNKSDKTTYFPSIPSEPGSRPHLCLGRRYMVTQLTIATTTTGRNPPRFSDAKQLVLAQLEQ